jgi:hypothetical protein
MALPADNITTTAFQAVRREMADNIFKANGTTFFLLAQGRVELADGGIRIDEPLNYAVNSTVKSYSGYDPLDVSPTEEFTTAQYNWKQFAGSISLSGREMLQNSGVNQIFNLMKQKMIVAEESMRQHLDEMIHNPITSKSSKDFLGLDEIVEDGGATSTLGGINRADNTWWQNKRQTNGGGATGVIGNLSAGMRKFYNECSKGISRPDLLVSPYTEYEAYEDQNAGKLRLSDTRLLDVGFDNMKFKGSTWIPNENCIANRIYFLNTRYLRVKIHKDRNFVMTDFVKPHDQDAKVAQIFVAGNMTTNNSRFQGVLETGA